MNNDLKDADIERRSTKEAGGTGDPSGVLEDEGFVALESVGNNGGVTGVGERKIGVDRESGVAGGEGHRQRPDVGEGVGGGRGGEREDGGGAEEEKKERECRRRRGSRCWLHLIS